MTSTLAYSTSTADENRLRIARVAAAGRVMADRAREQRIREQRERAAKADAETYVSEWIADGFVWFGVKADVYPNGSVEESYRWRDQFALTHCDECREHAVDMLAHILSDRDVCAEVWAYDDQGRYSDVI